MKTPLQCLIVDDEPLAIELIRSHAAKVPEVEICKACEDSLEALSYLQKEAVDLVFLDIEMPSLNGFELLAQLNPKPQVIVISGNANFAVDGFKWDVSDFLLKPVSFSRFIESIQRVVRRHIETPQSQSKSDYFFIRDKHKLQKIKINELVVIESFREFAHLHTDNEKYVVRKALSAFENELEECDFMRVHRSYIVALNRIDEINGNTIRIAKHQVAIGRPYKAELLRRLGIAKHQEYSN